MMVQNHDIAEASTSSSCIIERDDVLSSLPEPIQVHILSLLPTKDAVNTLLLRTFGNLWTSIQNLDLSVSRPHERWWFLNFVDHVMVLHESPTIVKFSLELRTKFPDFTSSYISQKVDSWINFAIRKKVKILKLHILEPNLYGPLVHYVLPDFVCFNDSLTELNLVSCCFNSQGKFQMGSLKTLSLCTITLSAFLIEEILSGCPSLENLRMIKCYGLRKLDLASKCLKTLSVTLGEDEESRVEISCPNITSLSISGAIGLLEIKNKSSLIDVDLDFCHGGRYSNEEYHNVRVLLEELSHAKSLTICSWCILVLAIWEFAYIASPSFNRHSVVLKTMLTKWHFLGIANLLRSSPNLGILTVYIEPGMSVLTSDDVRWLEALGIDKNNFWNDETRLTNFWNDEMRLKSVDFDGQNYWSSQQPFHCLTNSLKIVKIHGCILNPYGIQLVKFLLRSSNILEKLMIFTKENADPNEHNYLSSEKLVEFSRDLLASPKASNNAVILFS